MGDNIGARDETQRRAQPDRRASMRSAIVMLVFVGIGIVLVISISGARSDLREAEQSVNELQTRVAELRQAELQLAATREQSHKDRLVIFDLLQQCRVADDIPTFTGHQLFLQHRGAAGFALWVPDGKHQLRIDATLTTPSPSQKNGSQGDVERKVEKLSWNVDLLPSTGYLFDLESDRKGAPVTWTMTAGNRAFEVRSETAPVEGFRSKGWSYSGSNLAAFPGQVRYTYTIDDLVAVAKDPPDVRLYDLKLNGRDAENNSIEIVFQATLISDAPARIGGSNAISILVRRRPDLLGPYQGGGYFDLQPPVEE